MSHYRRIESAYHGDTLLSWLSKMSEMSLLSVIEMCGGNFLASLAPNLSEPQRQGLEASPKSDE